MDWNMVGAMGESVGAGLFFISILYLAIQVRTAKQMMAVETAQRVRSEHHATYAALATSEVLSEALSAENGLDPKQGHVMGWYLWCVSNWENQYELFRMGLIDQSIMDMTVAGFRNFALFRPSFRNFWRTTEFVTADFREYLESYLSDEQREIFLEGRDDAA
jgi:hypothetical protein